MLRLPSSVTGVTKHHEDFVRCKSAKAKRTSRCNAVDQCMDPIVPEKSSKTSEASGTPIDAHSQAKEKSPTVSSHSEADSKSQSPMS